MEVPWVQADEIPAMPAFLADWDLYAMGGYDLVLSLTKDRRQRQLYEALLVGVLKSSACARPSRSVRPVCHQLMQRLLSDRICERLRAACPATPRFTS